MEKWQESRNYRRIKNENGEVIANIITVDGVDVEVTEEVYCTARWPHPPPDAQGMSATAGL